MQYELATGMRTTGIGQTQRRRSGVGITGLPGYRFCSWSTANGAIAIATKEASAGPSFGDSYATNAIARRQAGAASAMAASRSAIRVRAGSGSGPTRSRRAERSDVPTTRLGPVRVPG